MNTEPDPDASTTAVGRVLAMSAGWPVALRAIGRLVRFLATIAAGLGVAFAVLEGDLGIPKKLELPAAISGGLLAAGIVLLFTRGRFVDPFRGRRARPLSRLYRDAGSELAWRIENAARWVTGSQKRNQHSTPPDRSGWQELEAFYVRWLNLQRDRREGLRESLLREGIDMIKLGDALRSSRPR